MTNTSRIPWPNSSLQIFALFRFFPRMLGAAVLTKGDDKELFWDQMGEKWSFYCVLSWNKSRTHAHWLSFDILPGLARERKRKHKRKFRVSLQKWRNENKSCWAFTIVTSDQKKFWSLQVAKLFLVTHEHCCAFPILNEALHLQLVFFLACLLARVSVFHDLNFSDVENKFSERKLQKCNGGECRKKSFIGSLEQRMVPASNKYFTCSRFILKVSLTWFPWAV